MTVSITFSTTNGGSAITSLDNGIATAGSPTAEQEIFIRHDGENQISNCGFYLAAKSGTYGGDFSAAADLAEMLEWGDATTEASFGGFLVNMDATGGYTTWPTYSSKSGTSYNTCRTGAGDSSTNKILLAVNMGLTGSAGTLQTGDEPNVRFKCRIAIPSDEGVLGVRQFDQKLHFVYTS